MNPNVKGLSVNDYHTLKEMRLLLKRKPELITRLLSGVSEDLALEVLKTASIEANKLHNVIEAFANASTTLLKATKKTKNESIPTNP
jgi:hypothetical protein